MIKEEHLERQDAPTILSVVAVSPCSRQLDVNAAGRPLAGDVRLNAKIAVSLKKTEARRMLEIC